MMFFVCCPNLIQEYWINGVIRNGESSNIVVTSALAGDLGKFSLKISPKVALLHLIQGILPILV